MRGKPTDLTGMTFSRLSVLSRSGADATGAAMWLCRCQCGTQKRVRAKSLLDRTQLSCGCYRRDKKETCGGMYGTPEYTSWSGMIDRCRRKKSKSFKNYGGRGIKVCDRWRGRCGFLNFLADLGKKPTDRHTIERVDNEKGYEPGNCRWATKTEQAVNTRHARSVTHLGRTMCVMEWSRETGIHWQTIIRRLNCGLSPEQALTNPIRKSNREPIEFDGKRMTLTEWARHLNLKVTALSRRMKKGWSLDRALSSEDKRKS